MAVEVAVVPREVSPVRISDTTTAIVSMSSADSCTVCVSVS